MARLQPGTRVRHELTGQTALAVGTPEHTGRFPLVPVFLEASTRRELWPQHFAVPLPLIDQCVALGGTFTPPNQYPLIGPKT